jgi:hypothetical protein
VTPLSLPFSTRFATRAALVVALAASPLHAQRVLGPGDDAWVLPGGVMRVQIAPAWSFARERWADGGTAARRGELEPLGSLLSRESWDASVLETLGPVEGALRSLSGLGAFNASLGRAVVDMESAVSRTPLRIDLGITSRLTVGVMVPYVIAQQEVTFHPNPDGTGGTVALNPAHDLAAARTRNAAVVAEFDAAAFALQSKLDACDADPSQAGCGPLIADRAAAEALIASTNTYLAGLLSVFGDGGANPGADFVPIAGTAAQLAIDHRIGEFDTAYRGYLGSSTPVLGSRPFAAQASMALEDAQRLLTDPTFGIEADALKRVTRYGIGDIELGAMLLLIDPYGGSAERRLHPSGPALRLAAGGLVRLGTGKLDSPNNLADIGTGDHQNDVEGRVVADVILGSHAWISMAGRYGVQLADQVERRIPRIRGAPFTGSYARQLVDRDLGDYVTLDVTPRWSLNEYVQVGGEYRFLRRDRDRYTGTFTVDDLNNEPVSLDASTLDDLEVMTQQQVGGSITFSTVGAHQRRQTSMAMDVSLSHRRAITGAGLAPKSSITAVTFRIYSRLWGADHRPPPRGGRPGSAARP